MTYLKRTSKGRRPIGPTTRAALAAEVEILGDRKVAEMIGVSPSTLARVLGGLPIIGATEAACRAHIERRRYAA